MQVIELATVAILENDSTDQFCVCIYAKRPIYFSLLSISFYPENLLKFSEAVLRKLTPANKQALLSRSFSLFCQKIMSYNL